MIKRKRIGIAGGSYNPIHLGHLIIIERFREQLSLDLVKIIPANISPSKINNSDIYISDNDRKSIIELAIIDNPFVEMDTFEIDSDGVSYTIDTLEFLKNKYKETDFFLLIGEDQAINFDKWKRWEEIAQITQICVAPRNTKSFDKNKIDDIFSEIEKHPIILNSPLIEISSTEIRNRIKKDMDFRYLVPKEVEKYIIEHHLFK